MEPETQQELEATLAARKELGPAHDEHLVEGFLARIEKEIDRRVDERVGTRRGVGHSAEKEIGAFIPLFVIAGIWGHATGIIAVGVLLLFVIVIQTFRRP